VLRAQINDLSTLDVNKAQINDLALDVNKAQINDLALDVNKAQINDLAHLM
jgi:predicted metalloenzyme YecM